MASMLSMLGRFAPRSMELICETLSLVAVAKILERPVAFNPQEFDAMAQPFTQSVLRRFAEVVLLDGVLKGLAQLTQRRRALRGNRRRAA